MDIISTASAPAAIGPYSQAVKAGGFLFCSGQIGLDPGGSQLVPGGLEGQTHQALTNLRAVLEAGGSAMDKVVKTTVYLTSMGDFPAVNGVYKLYFPGIPPARATVAVAQLPMGARVEIDAIATVGS